MDTTHDAILSRLVDDLKVDLGGGLLSVVLYGSAARGDHAGAASDLNVLVVVSDASPERLEAAARTHRAWLSERRRPLLFVTPDWIRSSTDVFPMEFLDMLDAHRVLHGEDPLAGISVSRANLRLQCESELRSKLLKLRTAWLDAHDRAGDLFDVITASYAPLAAIARAALRLAGEAVPRASEEVWGAVALRFGLDPAPLCEAGALKRSGRAGDLARMRAVFLGYHAQVEALDAALDALKAGSEQV